MMKFRLNVCLSLLVILLVASVAQTATAGVLFSENFESMTPGDLTGQNYWGTSGPINVGAAQKLLPGTTAINAVQGVMVTGSLPNFFHAIPVPDPTRITTLAFDGVGKDTDAAGLFGFRNAPFSGYLIGGSGGGGIGPVPPSKWYIEDFTLTGIGRVDLGIPSTTQIAVQMVINGPANTIETFVDSGGGFVSVLGPTAITGNLASFGQIGGWQDVRPNSQKWLNEWDNIVLSDSAIPEPSTFVLAGFMLAALTGYGRRRR